MKDKKLYLNIIRGQLQVRPYKTKECVYAFSWWRVIESMGYPEGYKQVCWEFYTEDIYNYLIHGVGIVWTDNFGKDRLTLKGIEMFRGRKQEGTEEEYRQLVNETEAFWAG